MIIPVTVELSTRERYHTTLPLTLISLAHQTALPDEVFIFDDNIEDEGVLRPTRQEGYEYDYVREFKRPCEDVMANILDLFEMRGIHYQVFRGKRMGSAHNHQWAKGMARNDWIWRIDDDNVAFPDALEAMWKHTEHLNIGAVGPVIFSPYEKPFPREACSGEIGMIRALPNIQWSDTQAVERVEHLHNTFLYNRRRAGDYDLEISQAGNREETLFSYGIHRLGHAMLVDPAARVWHFWERYGGTRPLAAQYFQQDEALFMRRMKEWGIEMPERKFIALAGGAVTGSLVKNTQTPVWPGQSEENSYGWSAVAKCVLINNNWQYAKDEYFTTGT